MGQKADFEREHMVAHSYSIMEKVDLKSYILMLCRCGMAQDGASWLKLAKTRILAKDIALI